MIHFIVKIFEIFNGFFLDRQIYENNLDFDFIRFGSYRKKIDFLHCYK
jgi:hypothetical protein